MPQKEREGATLIHDRTSPMQQAQEALDLVGRDPAAAVALAATAVTAARAVPDRAAEAVALRARALGCQELGQVAAAVAAGRGAVRAATRAGASDVEAEARMSLAFVLLESGSVSAALHQADRAANRAGGVTGARVATQRALILQRVGRHDDALAGYATALPVLRRAHDVAWEARLRNNRGLLQAYHGSLREAEVDLSRAMALYEAADAPLMVAGSLWNLGFVAARKGEAPTALRLFDDADQTYRRLNRPVPQLLLDRAEVLLSVGLFGEARSVAERAVRELTAAGLGLHVAKARLLLAQAALAENDVATGRTEARAATRLFRSQGRPSWTVLARHVCARAAERSGDVSRRMLTEALAVADELRAARWYAHELDMRLTAASVAVARGDTAIAREQLLIASRARTAGSLSVRLRACYAEALLRLEDGDEVGADRSLRAGTVLLERIRATVGATELRMHVSNHGREITGLGLRLAAESGSSRRVFAWAERARAAALRLRPVLPPHDAAFADALAELRKAAAEAEESRLRGELSAEPERRVARLEARVREHARHAHGAWASSAASVPAVGAVASELGDRALVELVDVQGRLHAVTLVDGRLRLHALGPTADVTAEVTALRTSLRRLASAPAGPVSDRALVATRRSAKLVDDAVFSAVVRVTGDRPLVLVPTANLQSVPWSMLPSLSGRPVEVAPSAAIWHEATRRSASPGGVLAVAGPRLEAVSEEVRGVAALRSAVVLTGPQATVPAVLAAMGSAGCVHIAAHGRLRSDNPLLSSLDLADGPLTVYDLERLPAVPRLVVLPACQSGASTVTAGDELMGLAHALLAIGAAAVVAAVVPVPDEATRGVMVALHRELAAGARPAAALAAAQRDQASAGTNHDVAAAGAFACFGAG